MASWTPRRPSQTSESLGGTFSQTTCEQTPISGGHKKQSGNVHRPSEHSRVYITLAASSIDLLYVTCTVKLCTRSLAVMTRRSFFWFRLAQMHRKPCLVNMYTQGQHRWSSHAPFDYWACWQHMSMFHPGPDSSQLIAFGMSNNKIHTS